MAFVAGQKLTAAALNAAIAEPFITGTGAWASWTPAWTAFTVGNAAVACSYFQVGKFVTCRMYIALGTTSVMGASPIFTLPVNANATNYGGGSFNSYRDVSASADYDGIMRIAGTTQGYLLVKNVAGANDGRVHINATLPFAWAVNDIISGYLTYEAA